MESTSPSKAPKIRGQDDDEGLSFTSHLSGTSSPLVQEMRKSTDESRFHLLTSMLGRERIGYNEAPPMPPLQGQVLMQQETTQEQQEPRLEDTKPAAKRAPSTSPPGSESIKDRETIISSLQARNKTLKMQLEASRQEITKLRQAIQDQAEEALSRHNVLQRCFIEYIQRDQDEKLRQRARREHQNAGVSFQFRRQTLEDEIQEALDRNATLQKLLKETIQQDQDEKLRQRAREQQAAASLHQPREMSANMVSDELIASLVQKAKRNGQRALQQEVTTQDYQPNALMGQLTQSLLQSTRSASALVRQEQEQPSPRDETFQSYITDNQVQCPSFRIDSDAIRAQLELERLQGELNELKKRNVHRLEEQVEELRRKKWRSG